MFILDINEIHAKDLPLNLSLNKSLNPSHIYVLNNETT